jgi:hypothetical protein
MAVFISSLLLNHSADKNLLSGEKGESHWVRGWGYRVGVRRLPTAIVRALGVFEQHCVRPCVVVKQKNSRAE